MRSSTNRYWLELRQAQQVVVFALCIPARVDEQSRVGTDSKPVVGNSRVAGSRNPVRNKHPHQPDRDALKPTLDKKFPMKATITGRQFSSCFFHLRLLWDSD
jgi:hypothetical protein